MSYYYSKTIELNFNETEQLVRDELQKVGFGILTEISVNDVFKNKLNVDIEPYKILGACNPNFAHRAISKEEKIGALLPCNVVLISKGTNTEVAIMNPTVAMSVVNNKELEPIAGEVNSLLEKVLNNLK
jgi:uncharacterized protein (DUF302 family)